MLYKLFRLIFTQGVISTIFFLGKSIFDDIKNNPIYSRDTIIKAGLITDNKIIQIGDGKIHSLSYKYEIYHQTHHREFQSNLAISKLNPGDSIILEIETWQPKVHKVIGYYETKDHKVLKRLF